MTDFDNHQDMGVARQRIISWITRHPFVLIALFLFLSAGYTLYVSATHHTEFEHSSAIRVAASFSQTISATREFYAREIVPRAVEAGVSVGHDYRNRQGTIPLPVTLSIEIGRELQKRNAGTYYRLYSEKPFPWQKARRLDEFERQALTRITSDPDQAVIKFDHTESGKQLRYATAVVMGKNCIDCHNSMDTSPYRNWKTGDVRGVQLVTIELPEDAGITFDEVMLLIPVFLTGLALISLLLWNSQTSLRRTEQLAMISKQRNTELFAAKIEAEHANEAKSRFLAQVSHELRTPLNSIIGFADILKNSANNPSVRDRLSDFANDIHISGTHLLSLINSILDMSKLEAGMMKIEEETIYLRETVATCIRLIAPRAESKSITLKNTLPKNFPAIRGDRRSMRQIMLNLLANSVKFTDQTGWIKIDGGVDDGGIWVTVSDNGIGIPADQIATIFEPFTQADNSLSRRHEGTGLGLPITKALVELHGGTIEIFSRPKTGTRVTFRLPADRLIDDDNA